MTNGTQEVSRETLKIQALLNKNVELTNSLADLQVELHLANEENHRLHGELASLRVQEEEAKNEDSKD